MTKKELPVLMIMDDHLINESKFNTVNRIEEFNLDTIEVSQELTYQSILDLTKASQKNYSHMFVPTNCGNFNAKDFFLDYKKNHPSSSFFQFAFSPEKFNRTISPETTVVSRNVSHEDLFKKICEVSDENYHLSPYEFYTHDAHNTITCGGIEKYDGNASVEEKYFSLPKSKKRNVLLVDLENISSLNTKILQDFSKFSQSINSLQQKMRIINISPSLRQRIKDLGLDRILISKNNEREALKEFGLLNRRKITADIINPFLQSMINVFRIQCNIDVTPERPFILKESNLQSLGSIKASLNLDSEDFQGNLHLYLPDPIFKNIASSMIGSRMESIEFKDIHLAGELLNIVFGLAKNQLQKEVNIAFAPTFPKTDVELTAKTSLLSGYTSLIIPFRIKKDNANFYLRLDIES